MSQQSALAAEKTSRRLGCLTRAQAAEKPTTLPSLCTQEAAERILHLVLQPLSTRVVSLHHRESSEGGLGTGAFALCGEAAGVGLVQPRE